MGDEAFAAFKAGFEASGEGFNGEYGQPSDERLRYIFDERVNGIPQPERCGHERLTERWVTGRCDRAACHDGPHSWE